MWPSHLKWIQIRLHTVCGIEDGPLTKKKSEFVVKIKNSFFHCSNVRQHFFWCKKYRRYYIFSVVGTFPYKLFGIQIPDTWINGSRFEKIIRFRCQIRTRNHERTSTALCSGYIGLHLDSDTKGFTKSGSDKICQKWRKKLFCPTEKLVLNAGNI